jgi:heat shock protein HtpX
MATSNFRDEIERLKKGIRVAWFINFFILWLVFIAAGSVLMLRTRNISNQQLLEFMGGLAVVAALVAAVVMVFVDKHATRILLEEPAGDAVEIKDGQLYNIIEEMSIAAQLKQVPRLFELRGSGVANAYASADSQGHAMVVVTQELLALLTTREEIEGVIAHEIGHIVEGDSQAMTKLVALTSTTAIIAGAASRFLFYGGMGGGRRGNNREGGSNPLAIIIVVLSFIFLIIAPLLSRVAESYMSRERESRADASAVKFTRNPTGIAKALLSLENGTDRLQQKSLKDFNKTIGPVAFFNPMALQMNLSTHPSTEKRVEKLIEMGAQVELPR